MTVGSRPIVMVVEDDIICQKFVTRLIERLGCRAVVAGDGNEALCLLERQRCDIVLMDITLPVLDGIEATKRIRASESSYASIPIVAVTGHAMKLNVGNVSEDGFSSFILKPVDFRALKTEFEKYGICQVTQLQEERAPSKPHLPGETIPK